jgi:hypothetical protein
MTNVQLASSDPYPHVPVGGPYGNGTQWAGPPAKMSRGKQRLIDRVQPLLPPGTQVRQVIPAGTKRSMPPFLWPFFLLGVLPGFLLMIAYNMTITNRLLVVTPDGIYVLDCGRGSSKPKSVLGVLPRATRLGPATGTINRRISAGPETLWTGGPFVPEVNAADAELAQLVPAGPVLALSPDGSHWWDGTEWVDCGAVAPPSAQRSPDGAAWWDGAQWRPVPAAPPTELAPQ